jgi:hypothetical protein
MYAKAFHIYSSSVFNAVANIISENLVFFVLDKYKGTLSAHLKSDFLCLCNKTWGGEVQHCNPVNKNKKHQ